MTVRTGSTGRLALEKLARRVLAIGRGARTSGLDAPAMIERLQAAQDGLTASPAGDERSERDERLETEEAQVAMAIESGQDVPEMLAAVPADRIVDVDVRDVLRAGGEPFSQIMGARKALQPGGVLRIRAIFEPAPLYFVLGAQGLDHWTEKLAEDDWRVWFFESAGPAAAEHAATTAAAATSPPSGAEADGDDVVILDVRGLEPPEPMVRTLEALETLPPGKTLVQINVRVPKFLLPMLENRGYTYELREQGPTLVRTYIRRA